MVSPLPTEWRQIKGHADDNNKIALRGNGMGGRGVCACINQPAGVKDKALGRLYAHRLKNEILRVNQGKRQCFRLHRYSIIAFHGAQGFGQGWKALSPHDSAYGKKQAGS